MACGGYKEYLGFLGIVLLLLTFGALTAQNQDRRVRNIVLLHGA
jgi:hypothetical protein